VTDVEARLHAVLEHSRDLGFLGSADIDVQLDHARGFVDVVESSLGGTGPVRLADLGTGGGLPGLVLAASWPQCQVTLVESAQRRAAFLQAAVTDLGMSDRVGVVPDRAEVIARDPQRRERFEIVTARSLAVPAITAELAAPFAAPDGLIVVSEPPESPSDRWDSEGLAALGLHLAGIASARNGHFAVLEKRSATPKRFPRPVGRASKRPLW
jgi:16S rRNA (guanine527-N7)-methyltransferase